MICSLELCTCRLDWVAGHSPARGSLFGGYVLHAEFSELASKKYTARMIEVCNIWRQKFIRCFYCLLDALSLPGVALIHFKLTGSHLGHPFTMSVGWIDARGRCHSFHSIVRDSEGCFGKRAIGGAWNASMTCSYRTFSSGCQKTPWQPLKAHASTGEQQVSSCVANRLLNSSAVECNVQQQYPVAW